MQSPLLPWEVIERLIGHSRDNPKSLRSFSLTCRELLPRSRCLMLAGGVHLKSRDHAFALVDFLQANPHLKSFISSIIVQPADLPPFPLLHILSDLSEVTFTTRRRNTGIVATGSELHPSTLTCFQRFGSRIQTLCLSHITFSTSLAFVQLLLAFSSITHLVCKNVDIQTGGNQAPLAVVKQHLSQKLRLQSLVSDSRSWNLGWPQAENSNANDVLLDPEFDLVSSTVESFEITSDINSDLSSHLRLSEWPRLRSLILHLPHNRSRIENAAMLLDNVNGTTCENVTIEFDEELNIINMIRRMDPRTNSVLDHVLLKFSRVNLIWSVEPLRAARNSFWTQELKNHFPLLFRRQPAGATLVLKSETLFPAGHDGDIFAFVVSPDSKWIASGSEDSTIIIWDTRDGSIAHQWSFPDYPKVRSLAFSPDSRYLVCGAKDGKAAVWDLRGSVHRMLATLEGHANPVSGCAWSPDGTVIATASSDAPMQLWDAATFKVLHVLRESHTDFYSSFLPSVTFSPDGHWLVSACSTNSYICIWNIVQGMLRKVIQHCQEHATASGNMSNPTAAPVFDRGSSHLLSTPGRDRVEILDVEMDEVLFTSPRVSWMVNAASFSPDGRLALVALPEGAVKVWDLDSGVELLEFKGHGSGRISQGVQDAHFSPCGKYIASAGNDCMVLLWRISDGTCVRELSEHKTSVTYVVFSPDGKTLSSAGADGVVVIRHMRDIITVEEDL